MYVLFMEAAMSLDGAWPRLALQWVPNDDVTCNATGTTQYDGYTNPDNKYDEP